MKYIFNLKLAAPHDAHIHGHVESEHHSIILGLQLNEATILIIKELKNRMCLSVSIN